MKHAVIFAHPNAESFSASVAEAYARAVEGLGKTVIRRDLYRMGFDPCLKTEELPRGNFVPASDVVAERAILNDVDVFALVYPLWLNAPPAMMKGYLERVFGLGFAYGGSGHSADPLLSGRKLIAFSSSGAPLQWVESSGTLGAVHILFDTYLAQVTGMTMLDHVHFGSITPGATTDFIRAHLNTVGKTVITHFGRTT